MDSLVAWQTTQNLVQLSSAIVSDGLSFHRWIIMLVSGFEKLFVFHFGNQ